MTTPPKQIRAVYTDTTIRVYRHTAMPLPIPRWRQGGSYRRRLKWNA